MSAKNEKYVIVGMVSRSWNGPLHPEAVFKTWKAAQDWGNEVYGNFFDVQLHKFVPAPPKVRR